jgi:rhodanese-related sulfurtransferase
MKHLTLAMSLFVILAAAAAASPAIHVDMMVYDFGSVMEGYSVAHTFVLTNSGDDVLRISGVRTDCGCTTTMLASTSLAPGESVDLDALSDTTGSRGTFSKTITVYSNDPGMPILALRVTGQVQTAEVYHVSASNAYYYHFLLIDLRDAEAYQAHHLLGAVNIPLESLDEALLEMPKDAFYILYDEAFGSAEQAATLLKSRGFYTSYALFGGIAEWIRLYGTRNVTNPTEEYVPSTQVSGDACNQNDQPSHILCCDSLDRIYLVYIDVRTEEEYAAGHIMGAVNIPFAELSSRMEHMPQDMPYIVYDQTGVLGDEAALWMINHDVARAQSMTGGLNEWILQFGDEHFMTRPL